MSEDAITSCDVDDDVGQSTLLVLINHGIRIHFDSNEDEDASMNDFLGQYYNEEDDQHRNPQEPDPRDWNPKIKDVADQDMVEEPDVFIDRPEPISSLNSRERI